MTPQARELDTHLRCMCGHELFVGYTRIITSGTTIRYEDVWRCEKCGTDWHTGEPKEPAS